MSSSQAPPSNASPAHEIQRDTSKATATPWSDVPVSTTVVVSGPLPTTNRTTPATGCESADTIRKLAR